MSNDKITVIITTETVAHSLARDLLTVAVMALPITVNEMTIQSAFMNFVFGMCGVIYLLSRTISEFKYRVVRGVNADDVIAKLRPRLVEFEKGTAS